MVFPSFVCNVVMHALGYVWPAYQCFKALEQRKPEVVHQWCTYWFVLAIFSTVEVLSDVFISWLPLYYEAKIVFVVYLWHPRFMGATSIYNNTVRPLLRRNEALIDRKLEELYAKAGDLFSANRQRGVSLLRANADKLIRLFQQYGPSVAEAMAAPSPSAHRSPDHHDHHDRYDRHDPVRKSQ